MPRHKYNKPPLRNNVIYNDIRVTKLINYIMKDGKKSVAEKLVYEAFEIIKKKTSKDPLGMLQQAITNVAPLHEVRPRRLGGASYLVPREVRENRRLFLSLNWIIEAASKKSDKEYKSFAEKLAAEILDAAANQGEAVNKKSQTEKLAEANKAFAHLRW